MRFICCVVNLFKCRNAFSLASFTALLGFISVNALAQDLEVPTGETFEQCKVILANKAEQLGFSTLIKDQVINNLSQIERVIALDKTQPEFNQSFAEYLRLRVTDYHITTGKNKLKTYKNLFDSLEKNYGIPRSYLVAFWGLETSFGKHKGKMSVLNALATLACDQRRSEFFTNELFDLFYLIDNSTVNIEQLQGSWAGAMGHMQFMPSAFRKYAKDGDKDNKVDIWESEFDALTTAAHYLQQIGWQSNERWGREVLLPENFNFSKIEYDTYYPLSLFHTLGIKQTNGQALPHYEIQAELFLPSGSNGPAFLLYPNFNVIMTWNLSKSYALSVGLLANQLVGESGMVSRPDSLEVKNNLYSNQELKKLQIILQSLGFETGEPDGIWGPKSRQAIRLFQLEHKLIADGFPNKEVLNLAFELPLSVTYVRDNN